MFGRYAVGLVLAALAVNIAMVLFTVVQTLFWAVRTKLRPDPFAGFGGTETDAAPGWPQLVSNVLLAVVLVAYTGMFIATAELDAPRAYRVIGFVAMLVAQAANIRSKVDHALKRPDLARAALTALPWAAIGAPLAWAAYLVLSVTVSAGDSRFLDGVGGMLTRGALGLGDWFLVRVAAVGLLLLFGTQLLMLLLLLPAFIQSLSSRRSR